jgi:hypothetical protein
MKLTMTPDGYLTATAQTADENQQLLTLKVDKTTARIRIDIQRDIQNPPKTTSEVVTKKRRKKYKTHLKPQPCNICGKSYLKLSIHQKRTHKDIPQQQPLGYMPMQEA